ncbi:hypothetical protein MHYP_G00329170 [Metynnis hypsauchen]
MLKLIHMTKSPKGVKRMGEAVDLVLGSSGVLSEDLNNPGRESELKVMYEKLRRGQWADFVWNLKKGSSDKTKQSEMKDIRKRAENKVRVGILSDLFCL